MAINTNTPVAVGTPKTANYFDLAHYDIVNDGAGQLAVPDPTTAAHIDVWWNAWLRNGSDPLVLVANFGPARISGADVVTVAADAMSRANGYVSQSVPAGLAYALGQRDAINAWLLSTGNIKTS